MSSRVDQDSRRGDGEEGISQVIRESEGEPGRSDPGLVVAEIIRISRLLEILYFPLFFVKKSLTKLTYLNLLMATLLEISIVNRVNSES